MVFLIKYFTPNDGVEHSLKIKIEKGTSNFTITDSNYIKKYQYTPLTNTFQTTLAKNYSLLLIKDRSFSFQINKIKLDKPGNHESIELLDMKLRDERGQIVFETPNLNSISNFRIIFEEQPCGLDYFIENIYNNFLELNS